MTCVKNRHFYQLKDNKVPKIHVEVTDELLEGQNIIKRAEQPQSHQTPYHMSYSDPECKLKRNYSETSELLKCP